MDSKTFQKLPVRRNIYLLAAASTLAFFWFILPVKAETVKLGFVTDWEYGKQKEYDHKLPAKAVDYLKRAVSHYNKKFKPDIIIGGGDYILGRNVSSKKAAVQLNKINKTFKKAKAARRYCIGNHDVGKVSIEKIKKTLGINYEYSATDIDGFRIITLNTNALRSGEEEYGVTGRVSDEELNWLEGQLVTEFPVVVFTHHSPVPTSEEGASRRNIYHDDELREVFEKNGNVVAVFSGHSAVNYETEVNGIHYVVINNLTDKYARGSYADIILERNSGDVSVSATQFGKKPANYSFSKNISQD